ncbi:Hydantoin racemase [Salinisphaera sp. LB1]|nr:Hydantoin racemase [Salinisphaera sp. LB1]
MSFSMRILVANVNTTTSMTDAIAQQERAVANPGTEIIPITPAFGAESIEGNYESYVATVAVMETIRAYDGEFDAIIQAGYGERGCEGLQELFDVPVVDITETAAATALFVGHR